MFLISVQEKDKVFKLKTIRKYLKSIFCSVVITTLCFVPGDLSFQSEFEIPHLDKFAHFCFYFVLSFIIQHETGSRIKLKNYFQIVIYVLILGSFIEIVQEKYITERSGDLFDLISDLLGAIIAFFIYGCILPEYNRTENIKVIES